LAFPGVASRTEVASASQPKQRVDGLQWTALVQCGVPNNVASYRSNISEITVLQRRVVMVSGRQAAVGCWQTERDGGGRRWCSMMCREATTTDAGRRRRQQ